MARFRDRFESLLGGLRGSSANLSVTENAGANGTPVFGGYVETVEKDPTLIGTRRYESFSDLLANVSIVATGTRYFLNMASSVEWTFEKSEADTDGMWADIATQSLFEDPETSWHRIVRRASMYRFYGFSVQEWTMRKNEKGLFTYDDVAPRAQVTIDRWDINRSNGRVIGCVQKDPYDGADLYLPRDKTLYLVDDTLSDSPEGLGLFRHIVRAGRSVQRLEELEGIGYETDLRGIPIARVPAAELAQQVKDGVITAQERKMAENPMRSFVKNHVRTSRSGVLLDSITYQTTDDKASPSNQYKWDLELMRGTGGPAQEVAQAIQRLNLEIARVLGVEGLLLGGSKQGSFALSKDKSQSFFLIVEATLKDLRDSLQKDLVDRLWLVNGYPPEMKPKINNGNVRYQDAETVATTLADMARAGAMLDPEDPVIQDVRRMLSVSQPVVNSSTSDLTLDSKS